MTKQYFEHTDHNGTTWEFTYLVDHWVESEDQVRDCMLYRRKEKTVWTDAEMWIEPPPGFEDYTHGARIEDKWDKLDNQTIDHIASNFAPRFQLDREFIEPLWQNATSQVRDHRESRVNTDDKSFIDWYSAREVSIKRVIGATDLLLYGQTSIEAI